MTCGSLGCGRQQYGGLDGNGHGLAHYESCGHGVSVKLGTITPEGSAGSCGLVFQMLRFTMLPADVYCYICNDSKLDPELAGHLSTFGINVQTMTKTEKSMTELVNPFILIQSEYILNTCSANRTQPKIRLFFD
jgi:ubiquitin carboxyl-terminal hydrolase 5/13